MRLGRQRAQPGGNRAGAVGAQQGEFAGNAEVKNAAGGDDFRVGGVGGAEQDRGVDAEAGFADPAAEAGERGGKAEDLVHDDDGRAVIADGKDGAILVVEGEFAAVEVVDIGGEAHRRTVNRWGIWHQTVASRG